MASFEEEPEYEESPSWRGESSHPVLVAVLCVLVLALALETLLGLVGVIS